METSDIDRISQRAYALWESAGSPEGQAEQFWYKAEQEMGDDFGDEASAQGFARDLATPVSKQDPSSAQTAEPASAKSVGKTASGEKT